MPSSKGRTSSFPPRRGRNCSTPRRSFSRTATAGKPRSPATSKSTRPTDDRRPEPLLGHDPREPGLGACDEPGARAFHAERVRGALADHAQGCHGSLHGQDLQPRGSRFEDEDALDPQCPHDHGRPGRKPDPAHGASRDGGRRLAPGNCRDNRACRSLRRRPRDDEGDGACRRGARRRDDRGGRMTPAALAFYLFAITLLTGALFTVVSRNPVHSVLWLILSFLSAAGLFVLAGAEFVAMLLIIVYVGAVAVLFLFVVMMLDVDFAALKAEMAKYVPLALLIGVIVLMQLALALGSGRPPTVCRSRRTSMNSRALKCTTPPL